MPGSGQILRRQFMADVAAGAAASLAACADGGAAEPSFPPGGYLDDHIHLTQPWFGPERGPLTASILLGWMDRHGIHKAFILPLVSPEAFWYPISTEFVLRETAPHRDRLLPFCDIDPRALGTHLTSKKLVVDAFKRYLDAGAIGCGEHKCRVAVDDPLNMRLYEVLADLKLPILFHLDNQSMMDRPGLPGLEQVLKTFPELVMIGHGKGWWASIAGGIQQEDLHRHFDAGQVAAGGAIDRLMDAYPNLYGDLSSGGAAAMLRDPQFGQAFLLRRKDRLLWGTDWYDLTTNQWPQLDLFAHFQLPDEAVTMIARGNAKRLFAIGR
ncbi:MAG: amidohydrolase family protein [Pirellulales bacterium]|nr:amidohydrolase family protein [Pirellulales bacterium]